MALLWPGSQFLIHLLDDVVRLTGCRCMTLIHLRARMIRHCRTRKAVLLRDRRLL